jgi:hypothetical protein
VEDENYDDSVGELYDQIRLYSNLHYWKKIDHSMRMRNDDTLIDLIAKENSNHH